MNHFNKLNTFFFIFILFIVSSLHAKWGTTEVQDSYKPLYHVPGQFNKFLGVDNKVIATSLFGHSLIYFYVFFAPLFILLFKDIKIQKILFTDLKVD